ncbi:MAG: hypothetical protein RL757_369 [Bacteroidota bacterium]|jgi:hypothetical protein
MKKHLLNILMLYTFIFPSHVGAQATTFEVENIKIPKKELPKNNETEIIKFLNTKNEKTSFAQQKLIFYHKHAFFSGIVDAYRQHYPMQFSPDAIWQIINMGFSRHVAANAESLRKKFVDFDGKQKLIVVVGQDKIALGNRNSQWEIVFPQFTKQISQFTGKMLIENLTADFTTTTPTTQIASQITTMDAMKHYFDYEVGIVGCGVSRVTLEGSVEDWEKVLEKTKFLTQYNLDWWTKELIPILEQFIAAKKGKVDKDFWRNMVRIKESKKAYGSESFIDGWVNKFYPYDADGKSRTFAPITNPERQLAPDLVEVPFILSFFETKSSFNMQFQAGFVGWSQDPKTLAMRPEIGWLVNHEPAPPTSLPTELFKKQRMKTNIGSLSYEDITQFSDLMFEFFEEIIFLNLSFRDEVIFDPRLANIRIKRLTLTGKISPEVEQKYRELKNISEIVINRQ